MGLRDSSWFGPLLSHSLKTRTQSSLYGGASPLDLPPLNNALMARGDTSVTASAEVTVTVVLLLLEVVINGAQAFVI